MHLGKECALITDGRFSEEHLVCLSAMYLRGSSGGEIALIRDGDMIDINIPERSISVPDKR